jgi:hypothetical protein
MKKRIERRDRRNELRQEYDLSKLKGGVRGKYVARYKQGTNLVLLSPDVAKYFPDEQAVNAALRALIELAKRPSGGRVKRFVSMTIAWARSYKGRAPTKNRPRDLLCRTLFATFVVSAWRRHRIEGHSG